jgi:serine/threonine-protein kinase
VDDFFDLLQKGLPERYTLERELGRGGMARVYLAQERHPQRMVAIKVLEPSVAVSLGRERFLREIDVVSNLTHPHIVPIFAAGDSGELLYFVMPFVEGETLSERINREGALSLSTSLRIGSEVAGALEYAHRRNIIHRDIKPDNILLHDGYALVADFGVSRAIRAAGSEHLTEIGITLGTPAYMSPEQASGEIEIDGRTDIYALGCVMYEMITGQPPFGEGPARTILSKHMSEPVPPLGGETTAIPDEVERAVRKALAKSRDERFKSAGEFAEELERFRSGLTSGSGIRAKGSIAQRRGWRGWLAAALFVAAVVVVTWNLARSTGYATMPELMVFTDSVAVMPVENRTEDPALDRLGDALTYGVINWLEKIPRLKLSSYLSVRALSGGDYRVQQLGDSLDVRLIVASQFRQIGGRVRLDAQLVDAHTGHIANSDTWTVELQDEAQAEQQLVEHLAGLVTQGTGLSPRSGPRRDAESVAYDGYLLGKNALGRRTPDGVRHAIELFRAAITIDSAYAPAYQGLSSAYALAMFYRYDVGMDGYDVAAQALANADRAIELDRGFAHGYAARGYVTSRAFGPMRGAAQDFRRALQLAPNASEALTWSGWVRARLGGKAEDALEVMRRGAELNPYAPFAHLSAAYSAFELDSLELAIAEARRTLEIEGGIVAAAALLGRALLLQGRTDECLALDLGPHDGVRAACLHAAGRGEEAAAVIDSIATGLLAGASDDSTFTDVIRAEDLACFYGWMGDVDRAVQWLDRAYRLSPMGVDQRVLRSRLFDGVRQDAEASRQLDEILSRIWPEVERRASLIR